MTQQLLPPLPTVELNKLSDTAREQYNIALEQYYRQRAGIWRPEVKYQAIPENPVVIDTASSGAVLAFFIAIGLLLTLATCIAAQV